MKISEQEEQHPNLVRPTVVHSILAERGLAPSKALGQNFLVDGNILRIILQAADLHPDDGVLEIGPGLGAVTEALGRRTRKVVAIEKDHGLYRWLVDYFQDTPRIKLMEGDALEVDVNRLLAGGLNKVVSNLPYSAGSRIMVNLFNAEARPERMVFMLQRDVGDRLTAEPGTPEYGMLPILARLHYRVKLVKVITSRCFYPAPRVQSAILLFERRPQPQVELVSRDHFLALLKWAFSRRRKQMANLLQHAPDSIRSPEKDVKALLGELGLDEAARPGELSVLDWGCLSNHLQSV